MDAPHSLEAEQAVLGAGLLYPDALESAAEVVTAEDFYRSGHQRIFRTMLTLWRKHEPVDLVTVKHALTASGDLEDAGGPVYLAQLTDGVPRSSNIAAYAQIVRQHAVYRQLLQAGRWMQGLAQEASVEAADALNQAQQRLYEIQVARTTGGFVSARDIVSREVLPLMDRLANRTQAYSGVPCGLPDIDVLTRGFQPSDLILLAARPSMGKTALALAIALHASLREQRQIGFFSLEMSRRDLMFRLMVSHARVDGLRARAGRLMEHEWAAWAHSAGVLADASIQIDDTAALTVQDIRTRARRMKATTGLDLIIVDYLQLARPTTARESRNLDVTDVSMGMKAIAKELDVPVLALSQLSRACEARSNKRPQLSDLRDSGALEQDADLVLFLYRDEVYDEKTADQGIAEIGIGKHRNGPTGTVKVGFDKAQTRFYSLARESRVA